MKSLGRAKNSIIKLLSPAPSFKTTGYFLVFILSILVAGCGGGGGESEVLGVAPPTSVNTGPVFARTGPIVAVRVSETAILDGSKSFTSSSAPLSYSWSFSYKPDTSNASLQSATTVSPSFTPDVKGVYMVQLVVSANGVSSQRAIQTVIVTLQGERHPTGRFNHEGLSSDCVNCHDGVIAKPGKSPDHIATSNLCQACHTPQGAAIIPFADHLEVFGNCSECHNGTTAIGKSAFHPQTNAECDDCHKTTHFLELAPDGSFDHSNISRSCSGCHNGTVAIGKTPTPADTPPGTHPVTGTECGYCHTTTGFQPAYPDHTDPAVVGNGCDSCHNGSTATGPSAGHPATRVDCAVCHNIETFSLGGVFDHSVIDSASQPCADCHNGNNTINAPGKASSLSPHIATNSDCGSCHNTETFFGGFIDHTGSDVIGKRCDSCHGVAATGKSFNHMPTSEDCSSCHTPGTFTSGIFSHGPAYIDPPVLCTDCHNNVITVGKLINHLPTDADCEACHDTKAFTPAMFDHTGIVNNCASCHDGNISTGKAINHLPTDQDCSVCHTYTTIGSSPAPFKNTQSVHVGVTGNCESCHSGNPDHVAVGAIGKLPDHIPALDECFVCHKDTASGSFASSATFMSDAHSGLTQGCEGCHVSKFLPTANSNPNIIKAATHLQTAQDCYLCHTIDLFNPSFFAHTGITGNCTSCHDGSVNNIAVGARGATNTTIHQSTNEDCGTCHNTTNFLDAFVDHSGPDVAGKRCNACHDGGAGGAIGKNTGHVPTDQDCDVCHVAGGTFIPAVFDHTGITDNCASCHNGTAATGLTPTHPDPLGRDCSVCHNTSAFSGASYDHTGIVNNCTSCHDGVTARGKTPAHVPTNGDCSNCHQTTGFIPATFDHVGITDNCASCHDAGFAKGKTDTHIVTDKDCSVCHNTRTFIGTAFDHTGIVDNCASCHAAGTAPPKSSNHLLTLQDCYLCHSTGLFTPSTFAHTGITGNCVSCHDGSVDNVAVGARGTTNTTIHQNTNEDCGSCHNTTNFLNAFVDHNGPDVVGKRCDSCHDGSAGGALGKSVGHVPTDQDCSTCHAPGTFTTAVFDHTGIVDNCTSCHDGSTAVSKSPHHLPTTEDCSTCHITTGFIGAKYDHTGIADNCLSCHNGLTTSGKSPDHIATSNKCEACHIAQDFVITSSIDHLEVFGNCSECHNGIRAIGKSVFHAPTNAECNECHNTIHFMEIAPDGSYDHSNILRSCSGCHNGTIAIGKTDTVIHNTTNNECDDCHTTSSFLPAYPDHTDPTIVGNGCSSCHNGSTATGPSLGHPVTNVDCNSCHNITTFSLGGVFNHRLLDPIVQSCESCHNESTSINAPSKSSALSPHIATNSDCGSCHNTETFFGGFIDHTGPDVVGNRCDSCHGVTATVKSLNHMPTSEDCSSCHTPGTFTSGIFSHGPTYIDPPALCADCHNNVITVGKLINHLPTNGDCVDCHVTTSFLPATYNHTGIVNNCVSCHDGNISSGKAINHLPTDQDCSVCHTTATIGSSPAPFKDTQNVHAGITGNCESCHSGNPDHAAIGAIGKLSNHIPAQNECFVCHKDTATGGFASSATFLSGVHSGLTQGCEGCHVSQFIPARPDLVKSATHLPTVQDCYLCHTIAAFIPSIIAHTGITDNCVSCHDGSTNNVLAGARGATNTAIHRNTNGDCVVCHNTTNFLDAFVDHNGPEVTGNRCDSCHNGIDATGKDAKTNPPHVSTTEDCNVCHVAGGAFIPAVFDHAGITNNCASCHNGVTATGLTPTHLPTDGKDCSTCHNTTAFAGASYDHTGIVNNCASCHDGVTARGKAPPPDHVPTNGDCGNCHQTTGFKPATFSHTGIVDNCTSCHVAGFAIVKPVTHVPTSQDCGVCHNTSTFIGAVFDHTGIVDNCASCHDGNTAIGMSAKINPAHFDTGLDCHACHTTATFLGGTWIHDATSVNQCDTCHTPNGGARSKPLGHLNTTVQCDECHSTNGWAPDIFSHDPQGGYPGDHRRDPGCSGCHGNSINPVFAYPFNQYAPFCAGCHANDFKPKGKHIGGESGTVEQNKNCAGSGCHRVTESEF